MYVQSEISRGAPELVEPVLLTPLNEATLDDNNLGRLLGGVISWFSSRSAPGTYV